MNCTHCGEHRPPSAHRLGWRCGHCRRCYARWMEHGFPASGPPTARVQVAGGRSDGRVEDYAWLRECEGLTRQEAAARLGVTVRSALRYEAVIRRQEAAAA